MLPIWKTSAIKPRQAGLVHVVLRADGTVPQAERSLQWGEGSGQQELAPLGVQILHTLPHCCHHSGIPVGLVPNRCPRIRVLKPPQDLNLVELSELAVEDGHQVGVARAGVNVDGRLKGMPPHRGTPRFHLEG